MVPTADCALILLLGWRPSKEVQKWKEVQTMGSTRWRNRDLSYSPKYVSYTRWGWVLKTWTSRRGRSGLRCVLQWANTSASASSLARRHSNGILQVLQGNPNIDGLQALWAVIQSGMGMADFVFCRPPSRCTGNLQVVCFKEFTWIQSKDP